MIENDPMKLWRQLTFIQRDRQANWPTTYAPADAEMEREHQRQIAAIREQLSTRRAHAEESPAVPVSSGNFFRRIMRRILPR